MMSDLIAFEELTNEHFVILHEWLQKSHVKAFWDDGDRTIEQVKSHYRSEKGVKRYIFSINEQMAGYIQTYEIDKENTCAKYCLEGKNNLGVDYFIGNEFFLNKGFALKILSKFIENICIDIDRIFVDPQPHNDKAIYIYKQYGFSKLAEIINKESQYWIYAINLRRSVRAVVLNNKNEILLMKIKGGPTQPNNQSFWCTLGGKIEKNELIEDALKRELLEEAGIEHPIKVQPIAFGEQVLSWHGFPTRLIEKFYAVHVEAINLNKRSLTDDEHQWIQKYDWWPVGKLKVTDELVFPKCLSEIVFQYLNSPNWNVIEIDLS